jgi:hypothetical protein
MSTYSEEMGYYVVLLLTVGVTIYALVDCWRATDDEVRGLPRPAWVLGILLVPLFGGIAYLAFGRQTSTVPTGRPRMVAPDDDPDFLRQLDQRRSQAEQQSRRERRERERLERQARKDQLKDQRKGTDGSPGGEPEGGDHSDQPTS